MATEENTPNLPTDILGIILPRLPAKSLLRFKTVSKSWNTMMSDPGFVQTHLHQSTHSNSQNLFLSTDSSQKFVLVKLEDREFQFEANLGDPYGIDGEVLCCCDGIILLANFSRRAYVLWNPCNRTKTMFWCPYRLTDYRMNYGICHDPTIDDFKVVLVSRKYYAVFSCKNNSWTKREHSLYTSGILINHAGVCVNGAIYWVWWAKGNQEIMYFDSRDDGFKILQKPKNVKDNKIFALICLKGCLCLYLYRGKMIMEIWIKEKGRDQDSWTELMIIDNLTRTELLNPLCFVENKVVMRLGCSSRFVVYSPSEKTFEEFRENKGYWVTMVPCVDSLFFPVHNARTRSKRKRNALKAN